MKNLYIDIDGVLLDKGSAAEGLVEFLGFVTDNFDCYWLTTHCDGDVTPVFLYLVGKVPAEALPYIEKIKPTQWGSLSKTEGIDFTKSFYWLDDNLFATEKKALEERNCLASYIHFDLKTNPHQLHEVQQLLKTKTSYETPNKDTVCEGYSGRSAVA